MAFREGDRVKYTGRGVRGAPTGSTGTCVEDEAANGRVLVQFDRRREGRTNRVSAANLERILTSSRAPS